MVKLETVQETVCEIVRGVAVLKASATPANLDKFIFADDGTQREAIEDALKSLGWAVVVSPPIGAGTVTQAGATSTSSGNLSHLNVLTNIAVRTNPKKNTGENAVNLMGVVAQIIKAALDWKPGPQEKGFTLPPERPFEPDFVDEGCFSYDLRLLKTVTII